MTFDRAINACDLVSRGEADTGVPSGAAHPAGETAAQYCLGLSNDYLNHYSEALMLIEMAVGDPELATALDAWRSISYRDYFKASQLKRAPAALAAYEALPRARRVVFERLVGEMDTLAQMASLALKPPCKPETAALVVGVTAPPLRRLIARAAIFLNSGGQDLGDDNHIESAQAVIDRVIEQAALARS